MATKLNRCWTQIRSRALLWDTITTTGWSTLSKSVGFLVPFFIAAWFGVTSETDAFFFAYGLILFFSGIFAPVVESIIVPYIAVARAKNEDIGEFVGKILCVSSIGLLVLTGIVLLVIKPILSLITHFDAQTLGLIYQLLIETAPLIILLTWTSILAGTLNAYKKFIFPAVSPAFRAIINLSIIFIFKDTLGVHAIAFGYVVSEVMRLAILASVIKRLNLFKLGLSFQFDFKLREFIRTTSYQAIGMVAVGLNLIIDKAMASWLGKGSVSVLHYAGMLYMLPISFMCVGLFPVVLSHWSNDYYQKEEKDLLLQKVKGTAKLLLRVSLVIFLVLFLLRQPLVHIVFARGKFNPKYLRILQWTFICYLFGLTPYVTGSMFTRAHLVLKNTSFLMKLGILNCFLNVLLNYILMQFIGIAGIALSTSITVSIVTILLFISFSQKTRKTYGKERL